MSVSLAALADYGAGLKVQRRKKRGGPMPAVVVGHASLDEAHQRLFVGCRRPTRFLVLDTANGKMSASPEIAGDTDDLIYDPARRRVYVTGGQGFIDILQQKDPDH